MVSDCTSSPAGAQMSGPAGGTNGAQLDTPGRSQQASLQEASLDDAMAATQHSLAKATAAADMAQALMVQADTRQQHQLQRKQQVACEVALDVAEQQLADALRHLQAMQMLVLRQQQLQQQAIDLQAPDADVQDTGDSNQVAPAPPCGHIEHAVTAPRRACRSPWCSTGAFDSRQK